MNTSISDRPRHRSLRRAGLVGAAALAVAVATLFANLSTADDRQPRLSAPVAVATGSFADVVETVSPAVVNIAVTEHVRPTAGPGQPQGSTPFDQFFGQYFQMPGFSSGEQVRAGEGSGFIVDSNGYIATNQHVINGADQVVVTLQSGKKLDATVVGQDDRTDIALLKVDAKNLPALDFGDSDHARVGDWVLAIGNPFGLGGTATAGIISARGRDINSGPYDDYLQIDAPINAGNSGGPVFNTQGQVIGINTAIYSPNGGNIGIGFAIPANQARAVIDELEANGTVNRGWLGVQIQSLDQGLASALSLDEDSGALIAAVMPNGPADRAGLEVGDLVTALDGQPVESAHDLGRQVGSHEAGTDVKVEILRDGHTRNVDVKLGDLSSGTAAASTEPGNASHGQGFGLALDDLTDGQRQRLGLDAGTRGAVVVGVEPGSSAAEEGIRPGDVIVSVNRKPVESAADAVDAFGAAKDADGNGSALVLVRRGDEQHFVAMQSG